MTTPKQALMNTAWKRFNSTKRNCERFGKRFSGYRGVHWCKTHHTYIAQVEADGIKHSFSSNHAKEAALFYDKTAAYFQGECAVTNKMMGLL